MSACLIIFLASRVRVVVSVVTLFCWWHLEWVIGSRRTKMRYDKPIKCLFPKEERTKDKARICVWALVLSSGGRDPTYLHRP